MRKHATTTIAILAAATTLTGCIERRIRVTSDPAGARVWLNDEPIGLTPCEAGFTYYGTYDIRLELDGHEPINEGREAHAPLHEYPGPDLIATVLPITFDNTIEWHFELAPTATGDGAETELRTRADEMRTRAQTND